MKGKIKIRTMKDDLANISNGNKEPVEKKQDQNKPNIATVKISGSGITAGATSNKLKNAEIGELKNLIEKISEDSDKKKSEEKYVEKKDTIMNMASKKVASEQQEQRIDLKSDEKKELKDLINKISETIDKKEDRVVQVENADDKSDEKREQEKVDVKKTENKLNEERETKTEIKKVEENKQSFWSDISKKLKDNKSAEPQRINAIKEKDRLKTKNVEDIKNASEKSKEEKYSDSGIITTKEPSETKKELKEELEKKKKIRKNFYDNDNYQLPENRLIFGKQKKYSSVSKRIKLKGEKDRIENLKNADEIKEKQKIISEKEKYEKLKNRVIKKYNVKLFSLPWKRIIPIAIVLIILSGAIYYILVRELNVTPPKPPVIISGAEIEKFSKVKNTVEFTRNDIVKMGFKENAINEKFGENNNVKELRIIIKDNGNIVSLKEALKNMKVEIEDFPNNFWDTTTKSYNIFAIKTERNAFRFAIAIESNNIASLLETMGNWEKEDVDKRKMFSVFEPFFTDSKTEEDFGQRFESAIYKHVHIRYTNLPDKNTSFDYFASDNILIITTSKENANRMIDILNDDYYNYYGDDIYEN